MMIYGRLVGADTCNRYGWWGRYLTISVGFTNQVKTGGAHFVEMM